MVEIFFLYEVEGCGFFLVFEYIKLGVYVFIFMNINVIVLEKVFLVSYFVIRIFGIMFYFFYSERRSG